MSDAIIKMGGGRWSLIRQRDGVGDSGCMLEAVGLKDDKVEIINGEVRLGYACRVGSTYARSYSVQDWWMTTPVEKILNVKYENGEAIEVHFKTRNSEYILKVS
jgi:hypothetical protein